MKKLIAILLFAALALSVAACGKTNTGDNDTKDTIEGSLVEILRNLDEGVVEMAVEASEVDVENSEWLAAIKADDFTAYVEKAAVSLAMMNAQPHHEILVKCKDAESALKIKDAIEENFDPGRWVCVTAEKVLCGISGTHVYMVASYEDVADKLFEKFEDLSGDLAVKKFEFDSRAFAERKGK